MASQSEGGPRPDAGRGRDGGVRRRPLLRAAGATTLTLALAGCLNRTVREEAVPLGLPSAEASEAGYDPDPRTEQYTVEREQDVGPATIKARVVSAIVEYVYTGGDGDDAARLAHGGAGEAYGGGDGGVLALLSTPKVRRAGRSFNPLSDSDLSDLVQNFAPIVKRVCNCPLGDADQVTVETAPNPAETTARPSGNTLYLGPGDGGSGWSLPSGASFLGSDISGDALATLYVPTVQGGTVTSYYLVGTEQFVSHETPEGDEQLGLAVYTGQRAAPDLPPDEPAPLLGPDGLFRKADVRAYNERFDVVLEVSVSASGQSL